ncbi:hypothetical protein [Ruicaihuangia caeni]|uniref:Uncharacterized protein n=1 Tax=Ruicaihuangia caeni TaxID=3042517 RepID=A0AAW6T6A9_9MICO|nr:hypothetical protein [Klugiella sp. YN-L-19]MDI2097615.1 hypothetical protein [Klugiella sp. YN-L-19]
MGAKVKAESAGRRWARWSLIAGAAVIVIALAAVSAIALRGGAPGEQGEAAAGPTPTAVESPGAEGPPADENATPAPTGLPLPSPGPALVSLPLPPAAHASGDFAKGFPSGVIDLPPESAITSTSLASEGPRLQAGLVGTSRSAPEAVLEHYRKQFADLGLSSREGTTAPDSTSMVFNAGENTITVTVAASENGTEFSVLGILMAAE